MRRTLSYVMLTPRNVCVAILIAYRTVISPLYGDVCRYYPSCSRYAMEAIQHHGVVRGVWLGSIRIARCHPWAEGGIDDIPPHSQNRVSLNRFGFAIPVSAPLPDPESLPDFAHSHREG